LRKVRAFLFKWRGGLVAPVALSFLLLAKPTAVSLAAGLLLACLGEGIRLWAIGYTGEPTRSQELDAPALVTTGPYGLVRNPLYLGNLLNGMAVATASVGGLASAQAALLWSGAALFLLFVYHNIIVLEQEFLLEQFGSDYELYCQTVPSLIPRGLRPRTREQIRRGDFSLTRALQFERMTLIWQGLIWAVLACKTIKDVMA
jgi:protein-S-isoprenylcysteine O-methyltransferase Ste14